MIPNFSISGFISLSFFDGWGDDQYLCQELLLFPSYLYAGLFFVVACPSPQVAELLAEVFAFSFGTQHKLTCTPLLKAQCSSCISDTRGELQPFDLRACNMLWESEKIMQHLVTWLRFLRVPQLKF